MNRIFLLACVFTTCVLHAQWSNDPTMNNPICTQYNSEEGIQMISDGSGGAIICWNDRRFNPGSVHNDEIYAQRIDSNGNILWTTDGIKVTPANVHNASSMCSDGNGGAFISWFSNVDSIKLCVQHINASGSTMWDSNGVIICSTTVTYLANPVIASDGNGGSIITWCDNRNNIVNSNDDDIYAQRINAAGEIQWAPNGIVVAGTTGRQGESLQIVNDGGSGAIFTWEDHRSGIYNEIYTQKVNSSGVVQWDTNGVVVNSITGRSSSPKLISDAGGAIICWEDGRNGNYDYNIYAQKVSEGGAVQWTVNGEAICLAVNYQFAPQLVSDGNGGAIFTWDEPVKTDAHIYAQRINASGTVQWTVNGVGVCLASNKQRLPKLASDGNSGAIITWQDLRSINNQNIYAQRINSSGNSLWNIDGVEVSTANFVQETPIILNDGNSGTIITWFDFRNDITGWRRDIYAQRLNYDGTLGGVTDVNEDDHVLPNTFTLSQNYPNPFNPSTTIRYAVPNESKVSITVFNLLGQEIATLINDIQPAGYHEVTFNAANLSSGVYLYRINAVSSINSKEFTSTKKFILLR